MSVNVPRKMKKTLDKELDALYYGVVQPVPASRARTNPLATGYSNLAVGRNIERMIREGTPRTQAFAVAYALARKSYFHKHPGGLLPQWLTFPKGHETRSHYTPSGAPIATLRDNPASNLNDQVRQAARRFEAFTGHRAGNLKKIRVPSYPDAALAVGKVLGIMYSTVRDGRAENYVHRFGASSRPLLAASPDGTQLFMLGGAYNFTERGIVDKKR